jgi:anthranilate phosphoribosyltransferase
MQLEFHQLDRRWEHLRVREPHRQRRLLASLADSGQQTPIVVVVSSDNRERYLVIDGHKRVVALEPKRANLVARIKGNGSNSYSFGWTLCLLPRRLFGAD